MATVTLDHVNKVYSNGFHAVNDLSVDIREGEFMVLVGPSGCGKTTALGGTVDLVEALGSELMVHFTIDARRVRAEGAASDDEDATAESGEGVARVDPSAKVTVGEKITFAINAAGMQFFDPDSGAAIWQ